MQELTTKKAVEEAVSNGGVVVLDFFAAWCNPCKALMPALEHLESTEEYEKAFFYKIDVDANKEAADLFDIMSVPTVLIVKDGKIHSEVIGKQPIEAYELAIGGALSS